uniref:C3H1-type domain-containing protein n=1 Tax=Mesocestoides corti TaxID=53468 RepID=A0A5K3FPK6_MESCO
MFILRNSRRLSAEENVLYKTKLCTYYERQGSCILGESCQFAHGINELRQPQDHPRYRTKDCMEFTIMGLCRFGDKCIFIHK